MPGLSIRARWVTARLQQMPVNKRCIENDKHVVVRYLAPRLGRQWSRCEYVAAQHNRLPLIRATAR